jgi:hypothetical protein
MKNTGELISSDSLNKSTYDWTIFIFKQREFLLIIKKQDLSKKA